MRAAALGAGLVLAMLAPNPAAADTIFQLSLPLTDQAATQAAVTAHGGTIHGGQFGPTGWTTGTRDDYIELLLPGGLDARDGKLVFSAANFEMSPPFTTHYWHFILVALDPFGADQNGLVPYGHAHLSAGHRGYWDEGNDNVALAYWNLADPACTAWQDCTTETGAGANFITGEPTVTWTFEWSGTAVSVTFEGASTAHRVMDLAATSSAGLFQDDQLIVSINNCGGSSSVLCGSWDEPSNRGGPLGVTYSNVLVEIYGEPAVGGAGGTGAAGGVGGAGGSDPLGGAGGSAASGGGDPGGADAGGASPLGGAGGAPAGAPTSEDSGDCGCRTAPTSRYAWPTFAAPALFSSIAAARRSRRGRVAARRRK